MNIKTNKKQKNKDSFAPHHEAEFRHAQKQNSSKSLQFQTPVFAVIKTFILICRSKYNFFFFCCLVYFSRNNKLHAVVTPYACRSRIFQSLLLVKDMVCVVNEQHVRCTVTKLRLYTIAFIEHNTDRWSIVYITWFLWRVPSDTQGCFCNAQIKRMYRHPCMQCL